MLHCYQTFVQFLIKIHINVLAICFHTFYFIPQFVLISNQQFQAIHTQQLTYIPLSSVPLISALSTVQAVCQFNKCYTEE